jgi:hypothetical protein
MGVKSHSLTGSLIFDAVFLLIWERLRIEVEEMIW